MSVTVSKSASESVALPRDPLKYRLSSHANRRLRELDRMMSVSLVKNVLRHGEIRKNRDPSLSNIELDVAGITYRVIVTNQLDSAWDRHTIVTLFPIGE